jgi:hypothetical protein
VKALETLTRHVEMLDEQYSADSTVRTLEDVHASVDFWYRMNGTWPTYHPVLNFLHAERLLGQVCDDDPWVTIISGSRNGDGTYVQVLGRVDRMVVEGGVRRNGFERYWRATARPWDETPTTVGPDWYRSDCWESDLLTVHDACALLQPGLADRTGEFAGVPGLDAVWW